MKMGVEAPVNPEQEEKEQEDQMIALYGKTNCHWDQAGRGGDVVRKGANDLCESLSRLSLGDSDMWEWDGWGYWDAEARIAMLEETEEGIEVEGYCKWTFEGVDSMWVEHADECVAFLEEIKVALNSSLERKVASLEADRWMFEGESIRKI
ncbi:uncharacterized protein N0V89_005670 [Didymosphaeria variabile]|uniref:Uncharacterized protein n=1 Tax=Didymosphaeria variabile TaxID=1932322 RepID=A0A9W8XMN1_9PLEO|nr:uncharacterized protein N0V89_005670 [Didymosphaeria variabile]KAJ4353938.1 hypothetical protein N0V89_005670 [Didymosphaeria variabile]